MPRTPDDAEILDLLCHVEIARDENNPDNRKACFANLEKIVSIAKANPNAGNANTAAWLCCLLPGAPVDLKPIVKLVRNAIEEDPKDYDIRSTLGTLLYRAEDYPGAIAAAREAMDLKRLDPKKTSDRDGSAFDWIVLAMANFRAGRKEDAEKWLRQTDERIRKIKADPFFIDPNWSWDWSSQMEIRLLLGEAHRMITPRDPVSGSPAGAPLTWGRLPRGPPYRRILSPFSARSFGMFLTASRSHSCT